MLTRTLGRTGLQVSVLGFGCGAVGGLMVRGDPPEQERTVARALELGVTYFDTAPSYGHGESERNLGRVLAALKPDIRIGTKVRLRAEEKGDIAKAAATSLEASLRRLGRDSVDILHLHNAITASGSGETLTPEMVLNDVVPAFDALRHQGKTRFIGITAVGETPCLHKIADSGAFDTAQISYNLLNPTAAGARPRSASVQDYAGLLQRMRAARMGAIGIRILAGGALSGSAERHPIASPPPEPIGSGPDYATDMAQAVRFQPLLAEAGAATLAELIGIATSEQFEHAAQAALKGPLPPALLARLQQ